MSKSHKPATTPPAATRRRAPAKPKAPAAQQPGPATPVPAATSRPAPPAISRAELARRLDHHAPDAMRAAQHEALRAAAKTFAGKVAKITPASREQSLALTALQEALMWGNAAIACNPGGDA